MNKDIYILVERVANLLRSELREAGQKYGLQPVQTEALHYLSQCNRYSDTPLAVAEFLGLTKGTVSQTLNVLEKNDLIEKRKDLKDKRVVHLCVTPTGRLFIEENLPPEKFVNALERLSDKQASNISSSLKELLSILINSSERKGFGECFKCKFHIKDNAGRHCGLTGDELSETDKIKICREFSESSL